jgi:lysophospholipase L1-like esterase
MRPSARQYWSTLAVIVVATYGGFIALEAAIRMRCFGLDGVVHAARYSPRGVPIARVDDPKTLYRLQPGFRGFASGRFIRTNSLGFRGDEFPVASDGRFRVLCFGSSLTMGEGVADDGTWPRALATELSRSRPVDVMNMGIAAFTAAQSLNLAEEMAPRYHPDLVVVDLDPSRPMSDEVTAPPDTEPVASTVQRFSFAATSLEFVPAHLGVLVDRVTSRWRRPAAVAPASAASFAKLQERLGRLAALGRQHKFAVVILIIRPMADFLQLRELDPQTRQRIDTLSRQLGITFVDTFPIFAPTELPDDFIVFPGNLHPSAAANRRFAHAIAQSLAAVPK